MSAAAQSVFKNEPYTDFSVPENRAAMEKALADVRAQLGHAYPLWIDGKPETSAEVFESRNPSRPSEIIGVHPKATREQAIAAIGAADRYFPVWSNVPAEERAVLLFRVAELLQRRKFEFNAWLVLEAGKSWIEAEADTAEAIDFCNYYAHQMIELAHPPKPVQMPGERGQVRYIPLGVGVIIPPWNFPLAILCGMAVAALVTGNTVVIKPSSDTPTVASKFVEVLAEAGFPPKAYNLITGSGASVGDVLVEHPRTRFISFTGSKEVGLRINELAAKTQPGQKWIKRVIAEMGGKDAIIVDSEADLDAAAQGVVAAAYGFQGQKCSACSRAIVDATIYDEFLEKIKAGTEKLTVGQADDPAHAMGPVINERARKTIVKYIEKGKQEGRLITGGEAAPGEGHYLKPTIIADIAPDATIFQEEIFGPVLAVTKANNFEHALELANNSEYGLTGAVYSRNREKIRAAEDRFFVGNLYLNRKCTGAMVGAHPFGGYNMSGTCSKAGGPDYLLQFLQGKSIAEKVS